MKTKLKQGRRAQAWPPGPAPAGNSQSGARAACVGHTGPSPPCTSLVYVSCVAPSGTRRPSRSWVHTDIRPHSCPFTHSLGTSSVPAPRDSSACHCASVLEVVTLSGQCSRGKAPCLVRAGFLEEVAGQKSPRQQRRREDERECLLLAASRSQTRMEPDWEPATMSSSGVLRRTLSTGDV